MLNTFRHESAFGTLTAFVSRTAFAAALALASIASSQTPPIPTGPWKDVFNKKDLTGWNYLQNGPWSVKDGILSSKGGSSKTFLMFPEQIKDMELEIKYKLSSDGANGGIQVRSVCSDRSKSLPTCGGTYQMCGVQLDVAKPYSGQLFEECAAFLANTGQNIANCRATLKVGEWTTTTARLNGNKISLWLNNVHCLDYTFTNAEHLNGHIFALQSHPPYDLIEYEHVKIRKLNVQGCTNKSSPNYNPEATIDNGTCLPSTTMGMSVEKWKGSYAVSASVLTYGIPESGPYEVRLLDVNGSVAGTARGEGPVRNASLRIDHPGLYFLEVNSAGSRSLHPIRNF
jgi:hypothetical protein